MSTPPYFHPLQHYPGFEPHEVELFSRFQAENLEPKPGFLTSFMGVRTRCTTLAEPQRAQDGQILPMPVPGDYHAEAVEYIGLLKSVLAAKGQFVAIELGAGWGPWLVDGAIAAKRAGITDIRLVGVEADAEHYEFLRQHFRDNGLDPDAHRLIKAAVGAAVGKARWPKAPDAANQWGTRPARVVDGTNLDAHDANYLESLAPEYIDIDIVDIADLLAMEPLWDLAHIDVQGWEVTVCQRAAALMRERVRYVIIGTHSRKLDGDIYDHFHREGWVLEHEKPTRMVYTPGTKELESMNLADGTQVWRNPRLS